VHPLRRLLDRLAETTVAFSYGKTGYRLRAPSWDAAALSVDLRKKTMALTGASSGIGLAAACGLSSRGAKVLLVNRKGEKSDAALATVKAVATAAAPVLIPCDLADLTQVRDAAAAIIKEAPRLDALLNNAGLLPLSRERSAQGFELAFATNVLAGFLLTALLRDALAQAAPSQVIHVTSGGMYPERLNLAVLQDQDTTRPYDGVRAYAQSKRAQVILSRLWAQRLAGQGIRSNCMHPGWAKTPGVEKSLPTFDRIMRPLLRSAEEGADTLIWLACSPEAAKATGQLFLDREARREYILPGTRENEAEAEALWRLCSECCGVAID
jgi:NAD(P)-dependent dehydrogenase (short-subunit alcohol dehydrogenase family)